MTASGKVQGADPWPPTAFYLLDNNHKPLEVDYRAYVKAHNNHPELFVLEQTAVHGTFISTVFLGIASTSDHSPPLLFETAIFGGLVDHAIWRHPSHSAALRSHHAIVQAVMEVALAIDEGACAFVLALSGDPLEI